MLIWSGRHGSFFQLHVLRIPSLNLVLLYPVALGQCNVRHAGSQHARWAVMSCVFKDGLSFFPTDSLPNTWKAGSLIQHEGTVDCDALRDPTARLWAPCTPSSCPSVLSLSPTAKINKAVSKIIFAALPHEQSTMSLTLDSVVVVGVHYCCCLYMSPITSRG